MSKAQMDAKLIVPLSGLTDKAARIETLSAEYKEHVVAAQDRYEKACEADITGENAAPQLRLTIIEQNAALMCQQEMLMLLTAAILQTLHEDPDALERPQAGGLAS